MNQNQHETNIATTENSHHDVEKLDDVTMWKIDEFGNDNKEEMLGMVTIYRCRKCRKRGFHATDYGDINCGVPALAFVLQHCSGQVAETATIPYRLHNKALLSDKNDKSRGFLPLTMRL